jgi:hypothetical protein
VNGKASRNDPWHRYRATATRAIRDVAGRTAIGAHDLNTLRVRIDLLDNGTEFEPGMMTAWLNR